MTDLGSYEADFVAAHEDHDVGWRHKGGSLFSATCHDCQATYRRGETRPCSCPHKGGLPPVSCCVTGEGCCCPVAEEDCRALMTLAGGTTLACKKRAGHNPPHRAETFGYGDLGMPRPLELTW